MTLGRAALLVGTVAFLPLGAAAQQIPPQPESPDSLRAMVLGRVRPPGTEAGGDAPADSAETGQDEEPGGAETPAGGTRAVPIRAQAPSRADDLMRALLGLDGFGTATYEGDRADFGVAERRLVLLGSDEEVARFSGDGNNVQADSSIVYDERDGSLRTSGPARFTPPDGTAVDSRLFIYSLGEDRGTAADAQTTYDGGTWIVRGNLDSVEEGLIWGSNTRFTTCDLDDPHTSFQASALKVVSGDWLVARGVRMYVADVPVFWLPFIAQNLGGDQASGLLTPRFSVNDVVRTSSGYNRRISNLGYFWAINEYANATVAMDWFSNNYTAMEGRLGYRWARRFMSGSLNVKSYWRAEGGRELALSTAHGWQISERASFNASGSYVSNSDFLRRNSFDPRETTQTVDSNADLSRRFDWGRMSLGASRRQYLTQDRTETTLPSLNLSLSTRTLFAAPRESASWYNNVSISGSTRLRRQLVDRPAQPDSTFSFFGASRVATDGSASGSLGLGDLSLSGSVNTSRQTFHDVPATYQAGGSGDFHAADVGWSSSLSYRVGLIGSTTLTPNVSLSGSLLRVDSIPEATNYVSSPTRASLGVSLRTDLYGFYPGFGPFDALRHKLTPSVSWSYAPEVTPTDLQVAVFGATVAQRRSALSFSLNQTWEARGRPPEEDAEEDDVPEIGLDGVDGGSVASDPSEGPTRLPPSRTVTLLSLQTSAVAYDLVRADSTGRFLDGFTTTSLSNSVGSDYLRGLRLSFSHDLFDDSEVAAGGSRKLSLHLSQLSMNFALDGRSGIVQAIGRLFGADPPPAPEPDEEEQLLADTVAVDGYAGFADTNENRVIPTELLEEDVPRRRQGWDANFAYSLRRPRTSTGLQGETAQMLTMGLRFAPTENWSVRWDTAYDIERRRFNDHRVHLTRDLHEWEATFSFYQTPTGNWSFNFLISLKANSDLHFDYEQRSSGG